MPDDEQPDIPELVLGRPFCMLSNCSIVDNEAQAVVKCDCGQTFRIRLDNAGYKLCPSCQLPYTHVLLICPHDDPDMFTDAAEHVAMVNGYGPTDVEDRGDDDEKDYDDQDGAPESD